MTILKALAAAIQVPGIDADTLEKGCIDAGIDGTGTYTATDAQKVDLAAADVLSSIITNSVGEGGFSYGIDAETLQRRINFLYGKWGAANNSQPSIRGVDRW